MTNLRWEFSHARSSGNAPAHRTLSPPLVHPELLKSLDNFTPKEHVALILACMVTARTLAMAVNRLLDAKLDASSRSSRGTTLPAVAEFLSCAAARLRD